ncbi:MAG: ABC transporter ATP-binding protein [Lachnospiraceae bacterium]|nr:ABC transporter ATP-binding protein [Lachnospiraceae bacterium]
MQSMNAIEVRDVTKIYRLYNKPSDRLLEAFSVKKNRHRDFYALNGVSFNVEKGSTVGIIGTNGSGKSTILKIITGVLTPSAGTVQVNGTVSALLELGAGFNMEYTGMENIYMNGTMMGYTRQEMDQKIPEILEFADIGEFIDQPVKSYSSGMFVRLAFALAINVEPDILIVDEALSVGDVFFQAKCYHKMEEIRKRGTTIVMVTHDMSSIIKYCDKVILLNRGDFLAEGAAGKMVDLYKKILVGLDPLQDEEKETSDGEKTVEESSFEESEPQCVKMVSDASKRWLDSLSVNPDYMNYGDGSAEIVDVGLFDEQGRLTNQIFKGSEMTIRMKVRFAKAAAMPIFAFTLKDKKGTELTGTNTMYEKVDPEPAKEGDVYEISFRQRMTLQGGDYLLSLGCTSFENGEFVVYNRLYDIVNIAVISAKNTVGVYDMESDIVVTKE